MWNVTQDGYEKMNSLFKILSFAYVSLTLILLIHPYLSFTPYNQPYVPASEKLIADFNSAYVAGEKLTTFLQDRVFSKKTFLHEYVPLNKCLTFAKESSNEKPREDLKMRATEIEQNAVINLVEDSQLL